MGAALPGMPSLVNVQVSPLLLERKTPLLDADRTNAGAWDGCPTKPYGVSYGGMPLFGAGRFHFSPPSVPFHTPPDATPASRMSPGSPISDCTEPLSLS